MKELSMREKSRLPMIERVNLPEVKELVRSYLKAATKLGSYYNLRVLAYYLGGKDNCEMVIFADQGSQKPIIIDYNSNGTQENQSDERADKKA